MLPVISELAQMMPLPLDSYTPPYVGQIPASTPPMECFYCGDATAREIYMPGLDENGEGVYIAACDVLCAIYGNISLMIEKEKHEIDKSTSRG